MKHVKNFNAWHHQGISTNVVIALNRLWQKGWFKSSIEWLHTPSHYGLLLELLHEHTLSYILCPWTFVFTTDIFSSFTKFFSIYMYEYVNVFFYEHTLQTILLFHTLYWHYTLYYRDDNRSCIRWIVSYTCDFTDYCEYKKTFKKLHRLP